MPKLILRHDPAWRVTRATPRQFLPPRQWKELQIVSAKQRLSNDDVIPKPPRIIQIPGVEGIGVALTPLHDNHNYTTYQNLAVIIAPPAPFVPEVLAIAQRGNAIWNPRFNTWDIPIQAQNLRDQMREIWGWIDELYFEVPWTASALELNWLQPANIKIQYLEKQVAMLNQELEWVPTALPAPTGLVQEGMDRETIIDQAIAAYRREFPQSQWQPGRSCNEQILKRLCVNFLRHQCSAYHVLLAANQANYLSIFQRINQAIGLAYPWLREECDRQIQIKRRNDVRA